MSNILGICLNLRLYGARLGSPQDGVRCPSDDGGRRRDDVLLRCSSDWTGARRAIARGALMGGAVASESRYGSSRKARLVPFVVLCVVAAAGTMYLAWSGSREGRPRELTFDSPYENVRAGVKYLGDSACVRCHSEIAASYARQPMGRSLEPIESAPAEAVDPGTDRPLFEGRGSSTRSRRAADASSTSSHGRIGRGSSSRGTRPRSATCSAPAGRLIPISSSGMAS